MIDAHIHIQAISIKKISEAEKVGVSAWFVNAAKLTDWEKIEKLIPLYPKIKPFFGIHPWYTDIKENYLELLEKYLKKYPFAGVGEIGLDKLKPWINQESIFISQLELAVKYNRIISIHNVKANQEMIEIFKKYKNKLPPIILHSFSGPVALVQYCKNLDIYFSLSPTFLKKKIETQKEILKEIPQNKLLFETDAPDAGSLADLPNMINNVAKLASYSQEYMIKITSENAKRLFNK